MNKLTSNSLRCFEMFILFQNALSTLRINVSMNSFIALSWIIFVVLSSERKPSQSNGYIGLLSVIIKIVDIIWWTIFRSKRIQYGNKLYILIRAMQRIINRIHCGKCSKNVSEYLEFIRYIQTINIQMARYRRNILLKESIQTFLANIFQGTCYRYVYIHIYISSIESFSKYCVQSLLGISIIQLI